MSAVRNASLKKYTFSNWRYIFLSVVPMETPHHVHCDPMGGEDTGTSL